MDAIVLQQADNPLVGRLYDRLAKLRVTAKGRNAANTVVKHRYDLWSMITSEGSITVDGCPDHYHHPQFNVSVEDRGKPYGIAVEPETITVPGHDRSRGRVAPTRLQKLYEQLAGGQLVPSGCRLYGFRWGGGRDQWIVGLGAATAAVLPHLPSLSGSQPSFAAFLTADARPFDYTKHWPKSSGLEFLRSFWHDVDRGKIIPLTSDASLFRSMLRVDVSVDGDPFLRSTRTGHGRWPLRPAVPYVLHNPQTGKPARGIAERSLQRIVDDFC